MEIGEMLHLMYKTTPMEKTFTLSIPKPCAEKWDNFTPTKQGGFCSSCSKEVIDFTGKSDDEILEFFIHKPTHACGRFRPHQLRTYAATMSMVKINPGMTLLKAGIMAVLFLLVSRQVPAQTSVVKANTEVVQYPDFVKGEIVEKKISSVIRGVIKDEYNEPLPGCNVVVKGTTQGTVSDGEGRFELHGDFKEGDVFVFSFIGYRTTEYEIRKAVGEVMEVQMTMDVELTGAVAVVDVYEPEPSGFRKWWSKVKGLF